MRERKIKHNIILLFEMYGISLIKMRNEQICVRNSTKKKGKKDL